MMQTAIDLIPGTTVHKSGEGLLFLGCANEIIDAFIAAQDHPFGEPANHRESDLRIVCVQNLKHQQLRELSNDDHPTLLVGIFASEVTLGPLQMRARSVCLACLQHWAIVANWSHSELPTSSLAGTKLIELALRLTRDALRQFELLKTVPGLEDSLTMVDAGTGDSTRHPVFSRKNCPACASLQNRKSTDLRVHCSPVTGIVKHLKCFGQPIAGIFQVRALFANPPSTAGIPRGLGTAWGRGTSAKQAEDSCIGEALESYSAAYRGDEPTVRARLADVAQAVDPRTILLYSYAQYETRDHWNKILAERHAVPEPFDADEPVEWLPGKDLTDGRAVWLPAANCLLGYPFSEHERKFAVATRAGCASGVSYSDALAGALLELIEHDAVAIWWHNQVRRPSIRLESLESPALLLMRDALQRLNRSIFLLDVTTDVEIPTYVAISAAPGGTQLLLGAAAHPSPRTAAELAASEVCQRWLCSQIARMPSDSIPWMSKASLENQLYCKPIAQTHAPPEPTPLTTADIAQLCIRRLNDIGIRPLTVDLSRPDVLLHTVRVIAPGLRSVHNRKAPGRLYDVPVRLGWLRAPLAEAQLNPICCVF